MKKNKKTRSDVEKNTIRSKEHASENTATKSSAESTLTAIYNAFSVHLDGGYFCFLLKTLKHTSSYKTYSKVNTFFKPLLFVMRFFRVLFFAIAWIQASALLLVCAVIALFILPVLLFLIFTLILVIRIDLKYKIPKIRSHIINKEVIVFFRGVDFSSFFFENSSAFAQNYTVLIVIPYPVKCSNNIRTRFLNLRIVSENVVIMYEHCYFSLRKYILNKAKRLSLVF